MSKYDKYREKRNQWKKDNPDKVRNYKLKYNFGITLKQYNEMLKDQNGVCAICEHSETVRDHKTDQLKYLSVDHEHSTGKVRALLCNSCNTGLGMFQDDSNILLAASQYLEIYKT